MLVGRRDDEHETLAPVVECSGRGPPVTSSLIRSYWVRLVSCTHPRGTWRSGRASSGRTCFVVCSSLDGQQQQIVEVRGRCWRPGAAGRACRPSASLRGHAFPSAFASIHIGQQPCVLGIA